MNCVCRQQKLVREAFGLSPKERLLLEERLYAKNWKKSSKQKTGEEDLEEKEEEEEEEEEVTAEELARLVEEQKLMGRDLRSVVRAEEPSFHIIRLLLAAFYPTCISSLIFNCEGEGGGGA